MTKPEVVEVLVVKKAELIAEVNAAIEAKFQAAIDAINALPDADIDALLAQIAALQVEKDALSAERDGLAAILVQIKALLP